MAQVSFEPLAFAVFVSHWDTQPQRAIAASCRLASVNTGALRASSEKYKGFGLALQVQDVKREEKSYRAPTGSRNRTTP